MTTEERVRRLEREVRWTRVGGAAFPTATISFVQIGILALLLGAAVGLSVTAQEKEYKEYGHHDPTRVLKVETNADGKREYAIDMMVMSEIIDDLAAHAKNYPPTFRSKEERKRAERDVKALAELFGMITAQKEIPAEILLKAGLLSSIGHSLDIKGSAQKAAKYFRRLLKREPDHAGANYHFGVLLAGIPKAQKASLPYLEKALKLGVEDARYTLGMAYVHLGNMAKALEYLEAYSKKHPEDKGLKVLVRAIKSGDYEVKKVVRKGAGQEKDPAAKPVLRDPREPIPPTEGVKQSGKRPKPF